MSLILIIGACRFSVMSAENNHIYPFVMRKNNIKFYYTVIWAVVISAFCFLKPCWAASIVTSKHNLSSTGPGEVRGVVETEICIFCHIPHSASSQAPLWSRYETGQTYMPYTSTTTKATIGQPTGASKLCLSCHDGTVALGMVRSRQEVIPFTGPLSQNQNLGTDLSDDHPVSFLYDSSLVFRNPELKDPSTLTGRVRLDSSFQVQCTGCHDPHNDEYGDFLAVDGINSNLCLQCHDKTGWTSSLHKNSAKPFHGIPRHWEHPGWSTVAHYGCQSCHRPHGAASDERLLFFQAEEMNCVLCHGGSVATKNISAEFNKPSIHPVGSYTGLHDPAEAALVVSSRHVECSDCHNPHAANDEDAAGLPGSLRFVKGINAGGSQVNQITREYELCFRCHADSNYAAHQYVNRQFAEINTRNEFDVSNQSFHPIENIGRNPDVPSLIAPLTTSSLIQCTDCHNNDAGPGNFGSGPNGPHGSIYAPLLERNLSFADNQSESLSTYALCYKCHDRNNILADRSFPKHKKHIVDKRTPCSACHDSHGVRGVPHLINFDRNIVTPSSGGQLLFEDLGRYGGRCYLTCHGEDHNPKDY